MAKRWLLFAWEWLTLPLRALHGRWLGSTIAEYDRDTGELLRVPGSGINLLDTTRRARLARGLRNLVR